MQVLQDNGQNLTRKDREEGLHFTAEEQSTLIERIRGTGGFHHHGGSTHIHTRRDRRPEGTRRGALHSTVDRIAVGSRVKGG